LDGLGVGEFRRGSSFEHTRDGDAKCHELDSMNLVSVR
jgi:hypothetical protein